MANRHVIAVDLGAASGRVMDASFDGQALTVENAHRFPNIPVQAGNTLYWDVLRLWHEITRGIEFVEEAASIGVDTWGVDFALLNSRGELLTNPVHYRDSRTEGAMEWVFERIPKREVFERTGIQFLQFNGLFQMATLIRDQSPLLDAADSLLTIADLFNYWLSGSKTCEFTEVTTMQVVNPKLNDYDRDMLEVIGIPTDILTPIIQPGTRIGHYQGIPVIVPACHDTGSAVVGVPATSSDVAYISSGTWSLLGLELNHAIINDRAFEANVTNEGGVNNTYRLLKNIMGLWLVQQCKETWNQAGNDYDYRQLVQMAESAEPFQAFIDPDDHVFLAPGDMPSRIRNYCQETGQAVSGSHSQIMGIVYESLAMKYRYVLEQLIDVSSQEVNTIHIIGGGSQNKRLCQMTANATGRQVIAGPVEATAIGNAIVQLIALGELSSIQDARRVLSQDKSLKIYEPEKTFEWDQHYERFRSIIA